MKEELVQKLSAFGLSPNQAKIYAYLCEVSTANIPDVTNATKIYAQDVYKTITALEKKGLVLKTKTQPIIVEAIPVERALNALINLIESDSRKEIETLKKFYKEINMESNKVQRSTETKKNYGTIMVLEKQAPESRIDLAFDRLKEEYDCVLVEGISNYRKLDVEYGKTQFKRIAKRGIKIKILVLRNENEFTRTEATKKTMPKNNYEIRTLSTKNYTPCPPFALIDSKELWLSIPSIGKEDGLILTDIKEMIEISKGLFEALWNDPNTKIEAKGSPNEKTLKQILSS